MHENLINEIQNNNLEIVEMNFKGSLKGLCIDDTIALNCNIETEKEKDCILAEEIGHYYTSYGNILDLKDIRNIKQEKKAHNWAYEKLVSFNLIIDAHKSGVKNKFELAEYLNVTDTFLEEAIRHYAEKYGTYCAINNFIIYFEPLGVLEFFNVG